MRRLAEDQEGTGEKGADATLFSPAGAPFPFTVRISESRGMEDQRVSFLVTGKNSSSFKKVTYHLPGTSHSTYLSFFRLLAQDFGLRLPQNRKPAPPPTFTAPFQAVLTHNLCPGIPFGYGDPAVIRVERAGPGEKPFYYLLATSNDAPDSFPLLRSRNLVDWEFVNFIFPQGQKPGWAAEGEGISDYWAPEMHQIGGEFRVYFVARENSTKELCIGLATAPQPEGPFVPEEAPLLMGNVIDPHVFLKKDGTAYLYWKEDNNDVWPSRLVRLLHHEPELVAALFPEREEQATASFLLTLWPWSQTLAPMERFFMHQVLIEAITANYTAFRENFKNVLKGQPPEVQTEAESLLELMKTPLYAQPLTPDGKQLVGERVKVLENDLPWEAHLVEGMWLTEQSGTYYLFYAGNDFSTDQYGIGVAISDSPLGPFQKMPRPILQSTADWWAPGHPSLVIDPEGKPVLFLHGYFPGKAGYKEFRALLSVPVTFEKERVLVG